MSGSDAIEQLNPEQQQAVIALLNEPTMRKAAEVVGVHEKTIQRWMDDPTFDAALRHARLLQFKQAMSVAQKYAPTALGVLVSIATDKNVAASARVSAAAHVARISRETIELDDLAARVKMLEQAQRAQGGRR
jgi:hypothetical protein